MQTRALLRAALATFVLLFLVSGCSWLQRKPTPAPPRPPVPGPVLPHQQPGNISEQEFQAVQASLKPIYFDYDRYSLSPEAQSTLQFNADLLNRSTQANVQVEGHCDERGTAEYNLALGERRARSAVDYLVSLGVAPNRLSAVSYGSELPVDPGHNEAAWAKNRRAYFRVGR
jgi:peptidoglycan-associated lipoprotein